VIAALGHFDVVLFNDLQKKAKNADFLIFGQLVFRVGQLAALADNFTS
jgi:hypothetical protein